MTCLVSSSTFNVTIQPFLLTSQSCKGKRHKFIINFITGDVVLYRKAKELTTEIAIGAGCTITLIAEKMQFEISFLVYIFWFN